MRSCHSLKRLSVSFSDQHAVADAGLLLPATLAEKLGFKALFDEHVDLGAAPGAGNVGVKAMSLIYSALAGGDCIDDADLLRSGSTQAVLGCALRAPSTLGTFLRSFSFGHARQLDVVSRRSLARAWSAGAGAGSSPLTIDLDSTICETYGLAKQGGSKFTYAKVRGYHPLLAVAAGSGEVLHARLRAGPASTTRGAAHFRAETSARLRGAAAGGELTLRADSGFYNAKVVRACRKRGVLHARLRGGPANTTRGAAHFLAETVTRLRGAGAAGELTLRADSGFYNAKVVRACRKRGVRFSITMRLQKGLQARLAALPEEAWTPIPYFMAGAAVAEVASAPFGKKGFPVRLIVRRVPPSPGSQLALFASFSYHAFICDREGESLALEADHRRHAEIENAIRDLKYGVALNHLPSWRFAANAAWLALQVMAHNLGIWVNLMGLQGAPLRMKTLRQRYLTLPGRLTRGARRQCLALPVAWPWKEQFLAALARLRALPLLA